jgi:hypothetical protein
MPPPDLQTAVFEATISTMFYKKSESSVLTELRKNPAAVGVMLASIAVAVVTLNREGHTWWCPAGDLSLWSWDIWSQHNSQHVIDPYSFTHLLHGVLAFWLISNIFRKLPFAWQLCIAVVFECCWEMGENSVFIIERYRAATISLDYFGDSIVNSMSDISFCITGFLVAYRLRFWRSLILFIGTEIMLTWWIHDSLLINIIMLIYPIEAIKTWQMGG